MMCGLQTNGAEVPGSGDLHLQYVELSSCPSMGKLKRNPDVIRQKYCCRFVWVRVSYWVLCFARAVFGLKAKLEYLACSLSLMYYAAGVSLAEASWSSFLVLLMFDAIAESLCLMKLMEMTWLLTFGGWYSICLLRVCYFALDLMT
ncbi:hypothetical protein Nepgr_029722 [Nepenthes gracilis]|uniref:Uncharacterized protein n=1 Tax=Nepenthes gracilis TaxID=150966 RepID=A0AAD3TEU8_NEPGR|nr:hypothetical protein Nepgr_029722 [Nepenthes gracilis]